MKYAPVIIPTLCRSEHFILLVESLKKNSWARQTEVFVGLDYPPSDKYRKGWEEICNYIGNGDFSCFAAFHVIRHKKNVGADKNIESLRNKIEGRFDRYIFLEDDNELSPNFLEYMDKCLQEFEADPDVIMITGYSYPVEWDVSDSATCMRQNFNASMWGAGFWMDKLHLLQEFIQSGQMLDAIVDVVSDKSYQKMIDASKYEYIQAAVSPCRRMHKMLMGVTDISVRSYLVVADKYVISPIISKVRNMGFDGSGLYCQAINTDLDGDTAGTYNYSQQPIDESTTFELVLNKKDCMDENRDRLNHFDSRTPSQMRRTKFYLWVMTHLGVWSGKTCGIILFPYDFGLRVFKKIWRIISK